MSPINFFGYQLDDESFGEDEESEEDEVDSDFDAPEIVNVEAPETVPMRLDDDKAVKKSVYQDPVLIKQKKERAEKMAAAKKTKPKTQTTTEAAAPAKRPVGSLMTRNSDKPQLRASTKKVTAAVVERKKKHDEQIKNKPVKAPKVVKVYTQEELLKEAEQTAKENRLSLLELMKYEENMKKVELKKVTIVGPIVRYHSKNGVNTITFTEVDSFPPEIMAKSGVCTFLLQLLKTFETFDFSMIQIDFIYYLTNN